MKPKYKTKIDTPVCREINFENKQDQMTIAKIFLVMVELSKQHPKRHFSFRGKWFKNYRRTKEVESLCQTVFIRHSIAFERVLKVFDFLLQAGIVREVETFTYFETQKNENSNEYCTYMNASWRAVKMFALHTNLQDDKEFIEILENNANLYASSEKCNKDLALQLSFGTTVIPLIRNFLAT